MLQSGSETAFARIRRIYGKPALLSGSLAYALYALVQIDQFHGSVSRTALNVAVGVIPCAIIGCVLAPVLVSLSSILMVRTSGARGIVMKTVKTSAVLGTIVALVVLLDHVGRAG